MHHLARWVFELAAGCIFESTTAIVGYVFCVCELSCGSQNKCKKGRSTRHCIWMYTLFPWQVFTTWASLLRPCHNYATIMQQLCKLYCHVRVQCCAIAFCKVEIGWPEDISNYWAINWLLGILPWLSVQFLVEIDWWLCFFDAVVGNSEMVLNVVSHWNNRIGCQLTLQHFAEFSKYFVHAVRTQGLEKRSDS